MNIFKLPFGVALLTVLIACGPGAELDQFKPLTEQVLSSVIEDDTTELRSLVFDGDAMQQVQALHRHRPRIVEEGVMGLTIEDGWIRADTAGLTFRLSTGPELQTTFRQRDGHWRLSFIGLPNEH